MPRASRGVHADSTCHHANGSPVARVASAAARWEAVIVTLARKHEGRRGAIRATVHYYGFAEAWDETLHDPSLRLQPSRKAERFAQAAVWRHNNGAASSSSTNGAASSSSASL